MCLKCKIITCTCNQYISIYILSPFHSSLTIDFIQYCFEKYSEHTYSGEPFKFRLFVFVRHLSKFVGTRDIFLTEELVAIEFNTLGIVECTIFVKNFSVGKVHANMQISVRMLWIGGKNDRIGYSSARAIKSFGLTSANIFQRRKEESFVCQFPVQ